MGEFTLGYFLKPIKSVWADRNLGECCFRILPKTAVVKGVE
jgi:hypothetical protein